MQSNQREKKKQKSETLRSSSIARRSAVQILNPDSLVCDEVRAVRRNSQGGNRTSRPSPPASPVNPFPPLLPHILAPGVEVYFSVLATCGHKAVPHLQKNLQPQTAGEMDQLASQCALRILDSLVVLALSRPCLTCPHPGVLAGPTPHKNNAHESSFGDLLTQASQN